MSDTTDPLLDDLAMLVASRLDDIARPRQLRAMADVLITDDRAAQRLGHAIGLALDKAALTKAKS